MTASRTNIFLAGGCCRGEEKGEETMIRLDKYLADMGIGTRSEVKRLIRQGRVRIDDIPCRAPEQKVEPGNVVVSCDGMPVAYQKFYYYMFHKPAGVVTAREDGREKTVMEVLLEEGLSCPAFAELSPAGRLDKDTEGLLLITNDGALIHRLLAPGWHVEKIYYARIHGKMTEEDVKAFAAGIQCSDFKALPAKLELLSTKEALVKASSAGNREEALLTEESLSIKEPESEVLIHLQEGKFHQVKRMVQAVGKEVLYLKRLSMGALQLDDTLRPGEWRELTKEEKEALGCQEEKG